MAGITAMHKNQSEREVPRAIMKRHDPGTNGHPTREPRISRLTLALEPYRWPNKSKFRVKTWIMPKDRAEEMKEMKS